MKSYLKIIFYSLTGLAAGMAAWSLVEAVLIAQAAFPAYLLFNIIIGAVFGITAGAFFGLGEPIILNDRSKLISGVVTGLIIGVAGGILGFLLGQWALLILGNRFLASFKNFNSIGLPIARITGWAILGIFVGSVEGVRARSFRKITAGLIGGLLGGILGAAVMELMRVKVPGFAYGRFPGFAVFGLVIGLGYGLAEKGLSFGVLRLLNGKYKGKEYLVNQRKIKIGKSGRNDIVLDDYENILDRHSLVVVKKGEVYIKKVDESGSVLVNDDPVTEKPLMMADVIKIGNAKFLYKFR